MRYGEGDKGREAASGTELVKGNLVDLGQVLWAFPGNKERFVQGNLLVFF